MKNANLAKSNIPDTIHVYKHVSAVFVSITKMNQMLKSVRTRLS
jgi:hypothetical protein